MRETIEMLRKAAERLRRDPGRSLIIPEYDDEEAYPLGILPGTYWGSQVADAIQFLADMLEA